MTDDPATLFARHLERTQAFSDALYDVHCRTTGRFDERLRDTLAVLTPLMSTWNAEILFVLRFHGPLRFNRILEILNPISPRVLTDKLRHLESHAFLARATVGGHSTYTLTPHGARTARLLHPLLYYLRNHDLSGADAGTSAPTTSHPPPRP